MGFKCIMDKSAIEMFSIDELVLVSFDSFVDWPAKIIDLYYCHDFIYNFDICLFHADRIRKILPFKSVRKISSITKPHFDHINKSSFKERTLR
jgi:hypothetical protein